MSDADQQQRQARLTAVSKVTQLAVSATALSGCAEACVAVDDVLRANGGSDDPLLVDFVTVALTRVCGAALKLMERQSPQSKSVLRLATVTVRVAFPQWAAPLSVRVEALLGQSAAIREIVASPRETIITADVDAFVAAWREVATRAEAMTPRTAACIDGALQAVQAVSAMLASAPPDTMNLRSAATAPVALMEIASIARRRVVVMRPPNEFSVLPLTAASEEKPADRTTIVSASSDSTSAKTATALDELVKDQEQNDATRQAALDAAKDSQRAQLEAALAAKRNRRIARFGGETVSPSPSAESDGTAAAPAVSDQSDAVRGRVARFGGEAVSPTAPLQAPAASESSVPAGATAGAAPALRLSAVDVALEPWMLAERQVSVPSGETRHVSLSCAAIQSGCFDNPHRVTASLNTVYTCGANGAMRLGDAVQETYFSMLGLDARLTVLLNIAVTAGSDAQRAQLTAEFDEWIDLALNLTEVYLTTFHDITQAEHLVAAVDAVASSGMVSQPLSPELAKLLLFSKAAVATHLLKICGRALSAHPDSELIALFANAGYPPEHVQAADANVARDTSKWAGHAERLSMTALAHTVAPPRLVMRFEEKSNGSAELQRLYQAAAKALATCEAQLNLDDDCEQLVRCRRMFADCEGTLLNTLHDAAAGKRRLECLASIKALGLNATVFSNVLRQADFETGTTHVALAELAAAKEDHSEAVTAHYGAALESFGLFCQAFRDLDRAATRERVTPPFEESDASAFLLGSSRRGDVLLKLGRRAEALKLYQEALPFLDRICAAARVVTLPEHTLAVKGLMQQMIATLSSNSTAHSHTSSNKQPPSKGR